MITKRSNSGYYGVKKCTDKSNGKVSYRVHLRHPDSGKRIKFGKGFETAEIAAVEYDMAVRKMRISEHHGKFPLNFPQEKEK